MARVPSVNTLALLLFCLCVSGVRCATTCFKNQALGDVEGNVYYCYGDEKPECCEENSLFTCCEKNTSKNVREQIQLWGTVAAFILVIGILFMCCKNDYSLCNDDKPILERIGIRRNKPDPPLTDLSQTRHRENTLNSLGRDFYDTPIDTPYYDRLPPLPPVTPFPEKSVGRNSVYPALDTPSPVPSRGRSNDAYVDDDEAHLFKKK